MNPWERFTGQCQKLGRNAAEFCGRVVRTVHRAAQTIRTTTQRVVNTAVRFGQRAVTRVRNVTHDIFHGRDEIQTHVRSTPRNGRSRTRAERNAHARALRDEDARDAIPAGRVAEVAESFFGYQANKMLVTRNVATGTLMVASAVLAAPGIGTAIAGGTMAAGVAATVAGVGFSLANMTQKVGEGKKLDAGDAVGLAASALPLGFAKLGAMAPVAQSAGVVTKLVNGASLVGERMVAPVVLTHQALQGGEKIIFSGDADHDSHRILPNLSTLAASGLEGGKSVVNYYAGGPAKPGGTPVAFLRQQPPSLGRIVNKTIGADLSILTSPVAPSTQNQKPFMP